MPAFLRQLVCDKLAVLVCVSLTGLKVSPGCLLQDRDIKRQVSHQLLQPAVLFLQLFEPFGLLYPHTTVLSTPAVIGLFRDAYLPAGFCGGGSLTDEDFNLS